MSKIKTESDVGGITCGPSNASVTWRIKDFFGLPQNQNYRIESPVFNFLDATWRLRLYPNAKTKSGDRWIKLSLFRESSRSTSHRIRYKLNIMRQDGSLTTKREGEQTFANNRKGCSEYLWMPNHEEERNEIVPEGVLTLVYAMSSNVCGSVETAVQTDTLLGLEKLGNDFKDLMCSGKATDFTLNIKNREYKVHSAVLAARSAVFSAMLEHDMKEKNSGFMQIDDCDPDAFQQFLTYVYYGNLENFSLDTIIALYNIADKYDTQELKVHCVQIMMDNLTVEIFCDVLSLSLKYNESKLLKTVIDFFSENLVAILITPKWLSFMKENPVESNELYIKAARYHTNCESDSDSQNENESADD